MGSCDGYFINPLTGCGRWERPVARRLTGADGATVQRGLGWLDKIISEFSLTKVKPKVGFEAEMIISCFQYRVVHL